MSSELVGEAGNGTESQNGDRWTLSGSYYWKENLCETRGHRKISWDTINWNQGIMEAENRCNGFVGRVVCNCFLWTCFISVLSQLLEILLGLKKLIFLFWKHVLKTLLSSLKRSVTGKAIMKIHKKVLADVVFHVRTQTNLNPWFTATVIPQVVTAETADLAKVVKPVFFCLWGLQSSCHGSCNKIIWGKKDCFGANVLCPDSQKLRLIVKIGWE